MFAYERRLHFRPIQDYGPGRSRTGGGVGTGAVTCLAKCFGSACTDRPCNWSQGGVCWNEGEKYAYFIKA